MLSRLKSIPWGRALGVSALVILSAFVLTGPALAAEFVEGNPNALVEEGEVIDDDLFMAGNRVEMSGTVTGDLFMAGNEVIFNGEVEGSLYIAGQALTINGEVGGSVVAAGFAADFGADASVARNAYFAGFSLAAADDALIERSLYVAGYQAALDGEIGRDVYMTGGAFELTGSVGGDVTVELNEPEDAGQAPTIWTPFFPGGVRFMQPGSRIADSASIGGERDIRVTRVEVPEAPEVDPGFLIYNWVRGRIAEFLALLVVGGLLLYLMRDKVEMVLDEIRANAAMDALWGVVTIIVYPLVLFLAVVVLIAVTILVSFVTLGGLTGTTLSLGGLTIGGFATFFSFVFGLVTKAILAYMVGRWILGQVSVATLEGRWGEALSLLIGALLYEIVRAIPLVGWLAALVVIVIGLGAIVTLVYRRLRPAQAVEA